MAGVSVGVAMHDLARQLWHFPRSITGDGVRQTLRAIGELLPGLGICEVPSGTQAFDWTVPVEWRVREAYIVAPCGEKICDFAQNRLHLVGYSKPFRGALSLEDLQPHLHSLPEQPEAIPYVTSYYQERWGFCMEDSQRRRLADGQYQVVVDTELFDGSLSYGELLIPGQSEREVLLSTYVCHPNMANNELSGPVVCAYLGKWLQERRTRRFTYRLLFIPETIGSIVYLSRNKDHLKARVFAGYNVSCVGDDRQYSYLPSRHGDTLSDRVARHVLKHIDARFVSYRWVDRGSDERQYCAPGIDLPVASIMRTKYGEYPEYHTSLDDLEQVVTPSGLAGGYGALQRAIESLERHCYPRVEVLCEPQLGKRGLTPTLSMHRSAHGSHLVRHLISLSDGSKSLLEIADCLEVPVWQLYPLADALVENRLLTLLEDPQPL